MRKSRSKRRKVYRDGLSELPDSLIHEILSLLPMRDGVRTAFLSKRWKDVWTTIPYLHFNHHSDNNLDKFRDFVSGALTLWKGDKILKFTLSFRFDHSVFTSDILDSWLLIPIEKQVEKLFLNLQQSQQEYYAPQRLYLCSSIRKLSLFFCQLKIDQNVQWNQLKSLTISRVKTLSEHAMNRILSGSPRLEVLDLDFMENSENLNIRSTSLKMLKIRRNEGFFGDAGTIDAMLSIWSPNLETLDVGGVSYSRCLLNVPSLTDAIIFFSARDYYITERYSVDLEEMVKQFFQGIRHVEKITLLSKWCIKVLLEIKKKGMLAPVSNATSLELYACPSDEIIGVLEMFPKLVVLNLYLCRGNPLVYMFEVPSVVKVDANIPSSSLPHLRTVDISLLVRNTSINPVIEFVLQNAVMLEKMVFRAFRPISDFGQELMSVAEEKVLSFPRASPTAEVIIRRIN